MTIERKRLLAVAVASRKIAFVFLIDGKLKDWQHSRAASKSPTKGRSFLRTAVARHNPDLVVIENPIGSTRKYGVSRTILMAMAQDLRDNAIPHRTEAKRRSFANKYDEAAALVKRFPEIAPWLPKRPRIWEREPTEIIYFEAISLADAVIVGGSNP